jgi:F-type H+-transporting ATPase subunit b
VLTNARKDHSEVVKERIAHIGQMSSVVDTTKGLFAMSKVSSITKINVYKELAKMEAEVFQLQQRVKYSAEIRSTLDSWVRYEAQARADQQRLLVEDVMKNVEASLKQPKLYDSVMQQTLMDVEGLLLTRD